MGATSTENDADRKSTKQWNGRGLRAHDQARLYPRQSVSECSYKDCRRPRPKSRCLPATWRVSIPYGNASPFLDTTDNNHAIRRQYVKKDKSNLRRGYPVFNALQLVLTDHRHSVGTAGSPTERTRQLHFLYLANGRNHQESKFLQAGGAAKTHLTLSLLNSYQSVSNLSTDILSGRFD